MKSLTTHSRPHYHTHTTAATTTQCSLIVFLQALRKQTLGLSTENYFLFTQRFLNLEDTTTKKYQCSFLSQIRLGFVWAEFGTDPALSLSNAPDDIWLYWLIINNYTAQSLHLDIICQQRNAAKWKTLCNSTSANFLNAWLLTCSPMWETGSKPETSGSLEDRPLCPAPQFRIFASRHVGLLQETKHRQMFTWDRDNVIW